MTCHLLLFSPLAHWWALISGFPCFLAPLFLLPLLSLSLDLRDVKSDCLSHVFPVVVRSSLSPQRGLRASQEGSQCLLFHPCEVSPIHLVVLLPRLMYPMDNTESGNIPGRVILELLSSHGQTMCKEELQNIRLKVTQLLTEKENAAVTKSTYAIQGDQLYCPKEIVSPRGTLRDSRFPNTPNAWQTNGNASSSSDPCSQLGKHHLHRRKLKTLPNQLLSWKRNLSLTRMN